VDAFLADRSKPGNEEQIRTWLTQWRDQREALVPMADRSLLLKEVVQVSQDLSSLATAGLESLDYIVKGQRAPDSWQTTQAALVEQASKPKAQLLLVVVAPIQKLIAAATAPARQ
jgi:hypothetical protein